MYSCLFFWLWDITHKNSWEDKQDSVVEIYCPSCIKPFCKVILQRAVEKSCDDIMRAQMRLLGHFTTSNRNSGHSDLGNTGQWVAMFLIHLTSHRVFPAAGFYHEYVQISQYIFELLEYLSMSTNIIQAVELSNQIVSLNTLPPRRCRNNSKSPDRNHIVLR